MNGNVLDEIRRASGDEMRKAAADRWDVLERDAKGRAKDGDVALLRAARATLGKTQTDDEQDAGLIKDRDALGDLNARQAAAAANAAKLRASAKEDRVKVTALKAEAAQLGEHADRADAKANSELAAVAGARSEWNRLQRRLAERGHPDSAAALQRADIESKLRAVDADLVGRKEHANRASGMPLATARREVAELENRKRELLAQLAEVSHGD